MSFPTAVIPTAMRNTKRERLVQVPEREVRNAVDAALKAAGRMRARLLRSLVDERVARARAHNANWWARGPLRRTEDAAAIERAILAVNPLEDDEWFLREMSVRMLEAAARQAMTAYARPDGIIVLSEWAWSRLDVYRATRNFVPTIHPLSLA